MIRPVSQGSEPTLMSPAVAPLGQRSRQRLGWPAAAALLAVGGGLLAGCGGPTNSSQITLTLYNGQHEQTTDALVAGFEKATGISVVTRNNDEDTLVDEIAVEGPRSPADLIYTENSPALEYLQNKDLLAHVDASTLAHTPSKYDSSSGDWVGISARVSVIIYNAALISKSQLPTHVLQLASPKYAGKLAFAPGETDFQPIVTSMVRAYGKADALEWLRAIKSNAGNHLYPDNETIADEVNRGQVAFGVVNQYYWYRMRAEIGASNMHSDITYFSAHDPGYVLDVSGAAILKSSPHQAAAQKFLAYLVSQQGQEVIGSHSISYEYPIASGVKTSAHETPFVQLQPNSISIAQLGTGAEAIKLLQEAQLL